MSSLDSFNAKKKKIRLTQLDSHNQSDTGHLNTEVTSYIALNKEDFTLVITIVRRRRMLEEEFVFKSVLYFLHFYAFFCMNLMLRLARHGFCGRCWRLIGRSRGFVNI